MQESKVWDLGQVKTPSVTRRQMVELLRKRRKSSQWTNWNRHLFVPLRPHLEEEGKTSTCSSAETPPFSACQVFCKAHIKEHFHSSTATRTHRDRDQKPPTVATRCQLTLAPQEQSPPHETFILFYFWQQGPLQMTGAWPNPQRSQCWKAPQAHPLQPLRTISPSEEGAEALEGEQRTPPPREQHGQPASGTSCHPWRGSGHVASQGSGGTTRALSAHEEPT